MVLGILLEVAVGRGLADGNRNERQFPLDAIDVLEQTLLAGGGHRESDGHGMLYR